MTEERTKTFLWSWSELEKALGIYESNQGPEIMRIIIDSRHALEGDLFVALSGNPGARFNPSNVSDRDGHDYLEEVKQKGGTACVVQQQVDIT